MYLKTKIEKNENNLEVFHILKNKLAISGTLIKKIKRLGSITLNGKFSRTIDKVKSGDLLEIRLNEEDSCFDHTFELNEESKKQKIDIIFQNKWLIICNKPPNLVTHPCYLHQTKSLTSLISREKKVHPISRLDKDTSGIVALGKCSYTQDYIIKKESKKIYLAFVHGILKEKHGIFEYPIARVDDSIMLRKISSLGQVSLTKYEVVEEFYKSNASILKLELLTGRTHQIRLHCLHAGHPLIGETLYGLNRLWSSQNSYQKEIAIFCSEEIKHEEEREKRKKLASKEEEPWSTYKGSYILEDKYRGDYSYHLKDLILSQQKYFFKNAYFLNSLIDRQALHAYSLTCYLPEDADSTEFIAPLPKDLNKLLEYLRINEKSHKV